jgi:hypothetical protein
MCARHSSLMEAAGTRRPPGHSAAAGLEAGWHLVGGTELPAPGTAWYTTEMKTKKRKVQKLQISKEVLRNLTVPSVLEDVRGGESVARPCSFHCGTDTCGAGFGCDTGGCGQEL